MVLDQNDTPLDGVKVKAGIRRWQFNMLSSPKGIFTIREAISGADGRFEIKGEEGDVLTIEAMEKSEYEPEPTALRSFGYNISQNITPDPDSPVLLRMWKSGAKEALISGDKAFHLVPDGRIYTIDLLKGTITESDKADGDLRIRIKRPLEITFGQRYDWSCAVEAINGGLLEETDIYSSMYMAPPDGYSTGFEASRKANEEPWGDRLGSKRFYVRSRGGQSYGRMEINLYAYYNNKIPGRVRIKYAVNPSGSRILR